MAAIHETSDNEHPGWQGFSAETRRQLIDDDRVAWRQVCTVLFSIIAFGLLLGATAVFICSRLTS